MKKNRAGQTRFGDYVRFLFHNNVEFQSRVKYYREFAKLMKRHPKEYRIKWIGGWLYYEKFSGGFWNSLSKTPADSGNDDILSYRLYEEDDRHKFNPTS